MHLTKEAPHAAHLDLMEAVRNTSLAVADVGEVTLLALAEGTRAIDLVAKYGGSIPRMVRECALSTYVLAVAQSAQVDGDVDRHLNRIRYNLQFFQSIEPEPGPGTLYFRVLCDALRTHIEGIEAAKAADASAVDRLREAGIDVAAFDAGDPEAVEKAATIGIEAASLADLEAARLDSTLAAPRPDEPNVAFGKLS